jgi:hypothetical protein
MEPGSPGMDVVWEVGKVGRRRLIRGVIGNAMTLLEGTKVMDPSSAPGPGWKGQGRMADIVGDERTRGRMSCGSQITCFSLKVGRWGPMATLGASAVAVAAVAG